MTLFYDKSICSFLRKLSIIRPFTTRGYIKFCFSFNRSCLIFEARFIIKNEISLNFRNIFSYIETAFAVKCPIIIKIIFNTLVTKGMTTLEYHSFGLNSIKILFTNFTNIHYNINFLEVLGLRIFF